jgi:IS30 family transposase
MASGYRHVSYEERCQIEALRNEGLSMAAVARRLGRNVSTISRELGRNSGGRGYRHKQAQGQSEARRREASSVPRKLTAALQELVAGKLRLQWSPEQIAGWLGLEGIVRISFQWIYERIRADREAGGHLYLHLRRQGRRRRRRPAPGEAGRGHIPGRVDISERPAVVEEKSRAGDWEVDTIIGAGHEGALVSVVDRMSKYTLLQAVTRKTASLVGGAVIAMLQPVKSLALTVTADNGKEFAGHRDIAKALEADVYFARPYHSWERGLNEHTNGLVRQYFGKSESLREVDPAKVRRVTDLLNGRPRKVLGYQTPAAVFAEAALAAA